MNKKSKLDLETYILLSLFILFYVFTLYYNFTYNKSASKKNISKLNITKKIKIKYLVFYNFYINNIKAILKADKDFKDINLDKKLNIDKLLDNNNKEDILIKLFLYIQTGQKEAFVKEKNSLKLDKKLMDILSDILYEKKYNLTKYYKEDEVINIINKYYTFPNNNILIAKYYKIINKTKKEEQYIYPVFVKLILTAIPISLINFSLLIGLVLITIFIFSYVKTQGKKIFFIFKENKYNIENFIELKDVLFIFLFWKIIEVIIGLVIRYTLNLKTTNVFILFTFYTSIIFLVFIIILSFFKYKYKKKLTILNFNFSIKNIFLAILLLITSIPIILSSNLLSQLITGQKISSNPIIPIIIKNTNTPIKIFLLYIMIGIIGPIFEEILFRGLIFNSLLKYFKPYLAIILTALSFALAHLDILGLLPIFILGLIFSYSYYKFNNIALPIIMHILWNSTSFLFMYILLK